MKSAEAIIIGGGISGASLLHWLASSGVDAILLERQERLGGVMWSHRSDGGVLVETGPNSATITDDLWELVRSLGLEDEVVQPGELARQRYVMREGRLVPIPTGPREFLRTPLLSASGRLRVVRELFVRAPKDERDESVASFVERRAGRELLDYAIDPFVAGVFAGRPELLSMRHAFPKMHALEREHGGLIRGAIAQARRRRRDRRKGAPAMERPKGMLSFREGMGTLPRAIARRWRERIVTRAGVDRIERVGGRWIVSAGGERYETERLIVATPAWGAAPLLAELDERLSSALGSIDYAPVTIAASLYARGAVEHPLDGFGMLIPARERRAILGTIFSSSLFPERAPEGEVLLTTFVGGGRQPEIAAKGREELEYIVHSELRRSLGICAKPLAFDLHRWRMAIPQYTLAYAEHLAAIEDAERRHEGLHLLGNYRGGISIGDCIASARALARRIGSDGGRIVADTEEEPEHEHVEEEHEHEDH